MTTFVALLRAINVGGHNRVPMAELRAALTERGFADVRTLLQSGNVVLRAKRGGAALERALEDATEERFGHRPDYVVRDAAAWDALVAANPFPREARDDPGRMVVVCCASAPSAAQVEKLRAAIVGREVLQAVGRDLYVVYPDGIGTSKLTAALMERHLGVRVTARNWNTVVKLQAEAAKLR